MDLKGLSCSYVLFWIFHLFSVTLSPQMLFSNITSIQQSNQYYCIIQFIRYNLLQYLQVHDRFFKSLLLYLRYLYIIFYQYSSNYIQMINYWTRKRQIGKTEAIYPVFSYDFQYCQTLVKHSGCVNALSFTKNDKFLVSGGDDLRVMIWVIYFI